MTYDVASVKVCQNVHPPQKWQQDHVSLSDKSLFLCGSWDIALQRCNNFRILQGKLIGNSVAIFDAVVGCEILRLGNQILRHCSVHCEVKITKGQ